VSYIYFDRTVADRKSSYFESILLQIPDDDVENVLVEPTGEWHTSDGKYGSQGWRQQSRRPAPLPLKREMEDVKPSHLLGDVLQGDKAQPKQEPRQVYSLCDSDEEEESIVTHELSRVSSTRRSSPSTRATSSILGTAQVIDLTLDSDEEDPVPSWSPQTGGTHQAGEKRKRRSEDHGGPSPARRLPTPVMQNGLNHLRNGMGGGGGYLNHDASRHGSRYDPRANFSQLPGISDSFQSASCQQQVNLRQHPSLHSATQMLHHAGGTCPYLPLRR
jgi:hypothetical protein